MRLRALGIMIGVLVIMLGASAVMAQYPGQSIGQGSSDIWVMNLGGSTANVVASYVDRDGNPDTSVGGTVDALGNTSFPASSSGLGNDWLGSMVLYSDQSLASVAELYWVNVPTGDGRTGAAYSGFSGGANEIFFPYVMMTKHQRSIVTIQCVDTVDCEVSMTYRDRDGVEPAGNPFTDVIEPDSQESYDLWDPTLNPNVPSLTDPWYGALQVTSDQDIAGVAAIHYRNPFSGAYNAFVPGSDTEVYVPFVTRVDASNNGLFRKASDWTSIVVQNMNAYSIDVYHSYYDRDGGAPVLTFSDTIPALSSHGYNTRYGGDVPAATWEALGTPFYGAAVISSTDAIVGVDTIIRWPDRGGGVAASYSGLPGGFSELTYPVLYRVKSGSKWLSFSGLVVQNLDPDDAVVVHHEWRDSDGTVKVTFDDTIPANSSHGYNTRYDADTPGGASTYNVLGDSWSGTATISTTSPDGIIGIVHNTFQNYPSWIYLSSYNAVSE
jgi:hypothetical protein